MNQKEKFTKEYLRDLSVKEIPYDNMAGNVEDEIDHAKRTLLVRGMEIIMEELEKESIKDYKLEPTWELWEKDLRLEIYKALDYDETLNEKDDGIKSIISRFKRKFPKYKTEIDAVILKLGRPTAIMNDWKWVEIEFRKQCDICVQSPQDDIEYGLHLIIRDFTKNYPGWGYLFDDLVKNLSLEELDRLEMETKQYSEKELDDLAEKLYLTSDRDHYASAAAESYRAAAAFLKYKYNPNKD